MKKYNAIRLLSLFVLGASLIGINSAYAATATVTSAQVTGPNQVTIVFSDPLDWAIGDFTDLNINAGARNVVSISETAPSSTVTITFDGAAVNTASTGDIDIAAIADGGSGNDFAGATDQVLSDGQSQPAPVLSYSGSNPTNSNPVSFSVDFGEDINAATFVDTDVSVSSGTVQNIVDSGDGQNFTFEVLGATDGATLSVQITGDIDDLAGNTGSADSNIVLVSIDLNGPAITIIGDNPRYVNFGAGYADEGATAFDVGDGDLTGLIITTGLPIDTFASGTHQVTYSVTDSNGNMAVATRNVIVDTEPVRGKSCGGDCYHPHFGVDQNGKSFYDDGLKINQVTYKISNVLHNHPDKVIELPVGVPVSFTLKASDTNAKSIRHMELALGIPKGDFDKQHASVIIDLDIDFQGKAVLSYEGDHTLVKDTTWDLSIDDHTATWHLVFTPTQHLQHDMFAISAVDEYQYVGTYYVNEGITFKGISQNGVPEFSYLDNRGHMHTLTIVDKTLEDLSVAVDEQGNTWNLEDNLWIKEYKSPENLQAQLDKINREIEALRAADHFDSNTIQGKLESSKSYEYTYYGRGHDPVPNMRNAFVDYLLSKPGTVNHSSYKLD